VSLSQDGVRSLIMVISLIPSILMMKVLLINTKLYVNKCNSTVFLKIPEVFFLFIFGNVCRNNLWEILGTPLSLIIRYLMTEHFTAFRLHYKDVMQESDGLSWRRGLFTVQSPEQI
jgi:hypothetical protein